MSRNERDRTAILDDLVRAADSRTFCTDEPWDEGWSVESYRRSPRASISSDAEQSVRLSTEGVAALEAAVERLLGRADVAAAWDASEVWSITAALVATLPYTDTRSVAEHRLAILTSPEPVLTVFALANVAWDASPLVTPDFILGRAGPTWRRHVNEAAGTRPSLATDERLPWPSSNPPEDARNAPVLFAAWTRTQGERARIDAFLAFEHLLTLSLLLAPATENLGVHSLRGDSHRPGVRGLTLHRAALVQAVRGTELLKGELSADVLQVGTLSPATSLITGTARTRPPLDRILVSDEVRRVVLDVMAGDRAVHSRVRAAARWHAKGHWSYSTEDAVLALGVAFESLISDRAGLPGRAVARRCAFLDPDPQHRAERARAFAQMYSARSSVAHGGRASRIEDPGFARHMASELRWATHRFLNLSRLAGATSDSELGAMFDALKWGTLA